MTDLPYVGATTPGRAKWAARRKAPAALALAPPASPASPAELAELAERLYRLAATLQALSREPSWAGMRRGVERAAEEVAALSAAPGLEGR